ncbi:2-phosphosulfolactate phosphatase [Paenibacillus puldeungensis]|uniref:Probable 2-phosphosulfolactate phosphatase n=1 Tax=Paenibacillus puldeungensis TaxID=696536 RepID=A0ABW3S1P6_9BACL
MKIQIIQGNDHQLEDADVNVVIDVIRAFTVAHYAFINGANEIILVGTVDEAFRLKETYVDYLLAGEVDGLPIKGFDLDNSPVHIQQADLQGKSLIQKTTNGVKAALHSLNAKHILVTGFSNAKTTAEYIKNRIMKENSDPSIHIIASHPTDDDDLACAEYIAGLLNNTCGSAGDVVKRIEASRAAQKFYDPNNPEFLREDIDWCIQELPSDFVMKVRVHERIPVIERVSV